MIDLCYLFLFLQELIKVITNQKSQLENRDNYIRDLENYIDNLLVRVMETTPRILQNPYRNDNTKSAKKPTKKGPFKRFTKA